VCGFIAWKIRLPYDLSAVIDCAGKGASPSQPSEGYHFPALPKERSGGQGKGDIECEAIRSRVGTRVGETGNLSAVVDHRCRGVGSTQRSQIPQFAVLPQDGSCLHSPSEDRIGGSDFVGGDTDDLAWLIDVCG